MRQTHHDPRPPALHGYADPPALRGHADPPALHGHPSPKASRDTYAASFALLAYMSTYSCPDNRMTSAITESVTARSTYRSRSMPS